jgi:hypothetical protein
MATDEFDEPSINEQQPAGAGTRPSKVRPVRPLPTDRVGLDKQLIILRAYAKASAAADGQAVSNSDVAQYAHLHMGSVSSCNPFLMDVGLLTREGLRNRPAQAVVDFDQASEWNPERAGAKLAPVIEQSWFGQVMLRRLSLRSSMPKSAAIEALAEEARAGKEYRLSLEMLLDYLRVSGVVSYDGTTVQKATRSDDSPAALSPTGNVDTGIAGSAPSDVVSQALAAQPDRRNVQRFSIPLPGKESVLIEMPNDMDSDDWMMLGSMLAQYIRRWKKFKTPQDLDSATSGEE